MSKIKTPISDLMAKLLAEKCPPDKALNMLREHERQATRNSAASMATLLNRRKWDKERKRLARSRSGGHKARRVDTTLSSLLKDSDSINKVKKVSVSGGQNPSGGHKPKAMVLPEEWRPSDGHYAECERAGAPREVCDQAYAAMRNWTLAEAHRSVTRKSNWNATFLATWLTRAIRDWKKENKRSPGRKTFGDVMMGRG